jgi:hypothetical protein
MRQSFALIFAAVLLIGAPAFGSTWIDFAGISPSTLPMTIDYPGGSVTVSEVSAPAVGTPQLFQYAPGVGSQGSQNVDGGVKMGIADTGTGIDQWEIKMVFSQSQTITVFNTETYTDFEDTILTSDGDWTQLNGSSLLSVTGLGSNTIALTGVNGPTGPFGYGDWTTTTTTLDEIYELDETAGGTAGNGIEIAVPEPASASLLGLLSVAVLGRRRAKSS